MTRIILLLKGKVFQEISIDLLEWDKTLNLDKDQNFELNVRLREYQVQSNIQELKSMYWKQIQKCDYDFEIILIFSSKINAATVLAVRFNKAS